MKGIDWKNINWKNVNRHVRRLQNSIAKSSEHGDHEKVKKLQAILWNSRSAKLLGIRKVTQDNQGRKTAGVDGKAKLSPKERIELVSEINVYGKWARVKQVEIPKPNGSTRTLGIPTMKDRARQAVMKLGLEPSYESNAEPNSYGFRPARSTQDAIDAIFNSLTGKSKEVKGKYIVEGDLKGFFDNIRPEAIIDNTLVKHDIELKKSLKNLIKSGGINPKGMVIETDNGTPQGGVISPLLANIAFTGLESFINEYGIETTRNKT
jgi:RNA-directed DNA polymerase